MTGPSSRMLDLLSLLQVRRDWSGAVLAERLDVTTRTVRRDVDRLRELGYRIRTLKGPDGGYRLEAGSELPPLRFDDEQAVAIAIALQNSPQTGVAVDEAADRALATIRQLLPARLRTRIDHLTFTTTDGDDHADPGVIEVISTAVRETMVLRFDYAFGSADGTTTSRPPRRVEPHDIIARSSRWYLLGWDLDAEDWRIFRVDRITPRIPTGPRFRPRELPDGGATVLLEARFKGSDTEDRWPCIGTVDIDAPAAEVARWLHDAHVEALTEETSRATLGSWSWTGLLAHVLRLDRDFRIHGPSELIDAARTLENRLRRSHR
ncbi:helix-turn-helix transcriptional regulator [Brevibacterium sp. GP-SGM9]|uniref:helix-turn-helix transcriptional regulator n=1 Tax=Brevibacterium sp. GP-SGM9 TaxID=3376990 RepID=UPI0039A5B96F